MTRRLMCRLRVVLLALVGLALLSNTASAVDVSLSGSLNAQSLTFNRVSDRSDINGYLDSANDSLPYVVFEIRTNATSGGTLTATIGSSTQFDSFLALYSSFNPASPQANLLVADDDGGTYPHARLVRTGLAANTSYFLVLTSYSNNANAVYPLFGNYALTLSGNLQTYNVTATASPTNGGTQSCSPNPVMHAGSTTCTAIPATGYVFTGWSGDCSGATCVLSNVQGAKSVMANFGLAAPVVSLSPLALTFADQILGTTSAARTVQLSNTGNAALSISSIVSTVSVFGQTNNCGSSLAAGASCHVNVTFTPVVVGTRVGSITITNNAAGSPHNVTISGVGIASNVPVCTLSADQATIRKGGTSILMANCSPAASSYSWTGGTCAGISAPTCTVTPAVTSTYGVTGTNSYGSSSASITVTVRPVDLTPILMLLLE